MALYSLKTSNHDIDRSRGDDDATKFSIQEIGAALEAKLPQLQAALASGLDFVVAQSFNFNRRCIYRWLKHWDEGGYEALRVSPHWVRTPGSRVKWKEGSNRRC
jgi:hypothetical protein